MTKGKKIALISVSAVIALVIITIIVLALVKTTFYSINVNNASSLRIFINGEEISIGACTNPEKYPPAANEEETAGQKIYRNIVENSKNNSQESILTCMLSGALSFEPSWELKETTKETIKEAEVVIEYIFDEQQVLKINDEVQKDNENNEIKYTRLMLEVNMTSDLADTKMYLIEKNTDDKSKVVVNFLSKQVDLYNYIKSLEV